MCVHLTPVEDVLRTVIAMIFLALGALSRRRRLIQRKSATKQNVYTSHNSACEIYVCVYFKCHIFNAQAVVRLVNL